MGRLLIYPIGINMNILTVIIINIIFSLFPQAYLAMTMAYLFVLVAALASHSGVLASSVSVKAYRQAGSHEVALRRTTGPPQGNRQGNIFAL